MFILALCGAAAWMKERVQAGEDQQLNLFARLRIDHRSFRSPNQGLQPLICPPGPCYNAPDAQTCEETHDILPLMLTP